MIFGKHSRTGIPPPRQYTGELRRSAQITVVTPSQLPLENSQHPSQFLILRETKENQHITVQIGVMSPELLHLVLRDRVVVLVDHIIVVIIVIAGVVMYRLQEL